MWINILNHDVYDGEYESCLVKAAAIRLRKEEGKCCEVYSICIDTAYGVDPRLRFRDHEVAKGFYEKLITSFKEGVELVTIDCVEAGII